MRHPATLKTMTIPANYYYPNKYQRLILFKWLNFILSTSAWDFDGRVGLYQRTVGIPMGTNCVPLVADLFLYSYEADFIQHVRKSKFKKQKKIL